MGWEGLGQDAVGARDTYGDCLPEGSREHAPAQEDGIRKCSKTPPGGSGPLGFRRNRGERIPLLTDGFNVPLVSDRGARVILLEPLQTTASSRG